MPRETLEVDGQLLTISPDVPVPAGGLLRAVVGARLVDELTGEPVRTAIRVEGDRVGLFPRVASDGLVGLVGVPTRLFLLLDAQPYDLAMSVEAERYVPRREVATLGPVVGYPEAFAPADLGALPMHREPVVIRGRAVVASGGVTTPAAGAAVEVTGIWPVLPPANVSVPADPPNLVSLQPPLYAARSAAAGQLRRRNVTPVVTEDKRTLRDAPRGAVTLHLSDRVNLSGGDVVAVDPEHPDLREVLRVDSVTGASTADQPARVTLAYPLAYPHRRGTLVRRVTLQAPGPNRQITRDSIAGDTCVFLNSLAGLSDQDVVEVSGGPAPEFHRLRLFTVASDADGYFRLPPLSRVALAELRVTHAPQTPITRVVGPNYSLPENREDFIFQ